MYFLVPCRNNKALLMQTLGPTPGSQVCIGWDACQTLYNPTYAPRPKPSADTLNALNGPCITPF